MTTPHTKTDRRAGTPGGEAPAGQGTEGSRPAAGSVGEAVLHLGDCRSVMATLGAGSVDAIVCDPPYPEIDRPYGRLTEADWHELMRVVVAESRRVLKPTGSAVFILQPNSERVGRMRAWLWEFMAWTAREWNQVQDFWWWNPTAQPTIHCQRARGLARPSVKACVWLGNADCFRAQDEILWSESEAIRTVDRSDRAMKNSPSGSHIRPGRCGASADDRGGVTPFNLIPIANTDSQSSAGASGHGAGTPHDLADWWVRYISPPGGVVLDPFAGVGTIPLAALTRGRQAIAIERDPGYFATMKRRVERPHLVVPRRRQGEDEGSPGVLFDAMEAGA